MISTSENVIRAGGQILTLKELANYRKVNQRTVYRLLTAQRVTAFRVGHAWRFRQHDIAVWVAGGGSALKGSEGTSG